MKEIEDMARTAKEDSGSVPPYRPSLDPALSSLLGLESQENSTGPGGSPGRQISEPQREPSFCSPQAALGSKGQGPFRELAELA